MERVMAGFPFLPHGVGVLGTLLVIFCLPTILTAQVRSPICGQDQVEVFPACSNCDFEEIAFPLESPGRAWRNRNGKEVLLVRNQVPLSRAVWVKQYSKILFWKKLRGSQVNIVFDLNQSDPALTKMVGEIMRRYPDSVIQKPWMLDVRIVPLSPWLINTSTVLPCRGLLTSELPIAFVLDRKQTQQLDRLDSSAFILSGTLSYFEGVTRRYITPSFSARKSELQILE